jgi:hypothetical protein
MKSFKLINPLIIGQFNTEYKAENGLDAISQFWNDLSTHLTNNLPNLYVTLKDGQNNLSHYKIEEKLSGGSKLSEFNISEFKLNLSQQSQKKFIEKVEGFEQKTNNKIAKQLGGAKAKQSRESKDSKDKRYKNSSSSSSSSSSDLSDEEDYYNFSKYKRLTQPISMWYYAPTLYGVNSVFVPTFVTPIVPYVKLWLPMGI